MCGRAKWIKRHNRKGGQTMSENELCWKCKEEMTMRGFRICPIDHCHHSPKEKKKCLPLVELARKGYPETKGIRLRYRDGSGLLISPERLRENPERIIEWINDWIDDYKCGRKL